MNILSCCFFEFFSNWNWGDNFFLTLLSAIFIIGSGDLIRHTWLPQIIIYPQIFKDTFSDKNEARYSIKIKNQSNYSVKDIKVDAYLMDEIKGIKEFKLKAVEKQRKETIKKTVGGKNGEEIKETITLDLIEKEKESISVFPSYKDIYFLKGKTDLTFYTYDNLEKLLINNDQSIRTLLVFEITGIHSISGGDKKFSYEFDITCIKKK